MTENEQQQGLAGNPAMDGVTRLPISHSVPPNNPTTPPPAVLNQVSDVTPSVCWRIRDCAPEIQLYCQHAVTDFDMCPSICKFAICTRPEHKPTWDAKFVFEPNIDRDAALKHACLHCEFFVRNGPKKNPDA
ncbi:MAG: hypothetical protein FWE46_02980, partial [Coriobacteriia bacterium]|nr:hypothetical protein [Coriobacteriia bacterium]